MKKFEYKIVFKANEKILNELGQEGWEAIGLAKEQKVLALVFAVLLKRELK